MSMKHVRLLIEQGLPDSCVLRLMTGFILVNKDLLEELDCPGGFLRL